MAVGVRWGWEKHTDARSKERSRRADWPPWLSPVRRSPDLQARSTSFSKSVCKTETEDEMRAGLVAGSAVSCRVVGKGPPKPHLHLRGHKYAVNCHQEPHPTLLVYGPHSVPMHLSACLCKHGCVCQHSHACVCCVSLCLQCVCLFECRGAHCVSMNIYVERRIVWLTIEPELTSMHLYKGTYTYVSPCMCLCLPVCACDQPCVLSLQGITEQPASAPLAMLPQSHAAIRASRASAIPSKTDSRGQTQTWASTSLP